MNLAIQALPPIDETDLWLVRLDAPHASQWTGALSADETSRASRFAFARDRSRYVAAHGTLRHLLSLRLGTAPESLQFTTGPFGKPALRASGLEFNLSHSQDLALVAIGRRPLGIDIEVLRPVDDWESLADAHFTATERRAMHRIPAPSRVRGFLNVWTRKEACLKAIGSGLSVAPDSLEVGVDGQVQVCGTHGDAQDVIAVQPVDVGPAAVASLACVIGSRLARSPERVGAFA